MQLLASTRLAPSGFQVASDGQRIQVLRPQSPFHGLQRCFVKGSALRQTPCGLERTRQIVPALQDDLFSAVLGITI